jgi:hypothetical protein
MRTQFLYVGLLSMTLAGGLVSAGCSDIHTGQPKDPGGPVKLVRILVQDDDTSGGGGLATAVDLLDRVGTPLSTARECDPDRKPCNPEFNLAFNPAQFECVDDASPDITAWPHSSTGFRCTDPLNPQAPDGSPIPVLIQPPVADAPGGVSGTEIRVVFSKVLNSAEIEDITVDQAAPPGEQLSYKVKDGIVELEGPDGSNIDITRVWDLGGAPINTSDVILNPFGPALVLKVGVLMSVGEAPPAPSYSLEPDTKYTVVLNTGAIHDRKGNGLADQFGQPLSGAFRIDFVTEPLAPASATPDVTAKDAKIATDDVIQLAYKADVAATPMATVTNADGTPASFAVLAYIDQGAMATMCAANADNTLVDITAVDAAGKPIAWPPGSYIVKVVVTRTNTFNTTTTDTEELKFTVDPAAMTGGDTSQAKHITPAQCT